MDFRGRYLGGEELKAVLSISLNDRTVPRTATAGVEYAVGKIRIGEEVFDYLAAFAGPSGENCRCKAVEPVAEVDRAVQIVGRMLLGCCGALARAN